MCTYTTTIITGERVLLAYPPGLDFFVAFLGCLKAGAIAVPVYPPDPGHLERDLPKFKRMYENAKPRVCLTIRRYKWVIQPTKLKYDWPVLEWHVTDGKKFKKNHTYWDRTVSKDDVAFLQYTSGSTGDPKGVMVTHGNLVHNTIMCMSQGLRIADKGIGVLWLPQYHDLGLIAGLLTPCVGGSKVYLMSPFTFLKRPVMWLKLMSEVKATFTMAPNFAYDLVMRKWNDDEPLLDLSSLTWVGNGAEPIRMKTINAFSAKFKKHGFNRDSFKPLYGLAENTVGVCAGDRMILFPTSDGNVHMSCGTINPHLGFDVRIVDPRTFKELKEGEIGEIWLDSPSKGLGYWNRPEATKETFHATLAGDESGTTYLRTGDLGCLMRDRRMGRDKTTYFKRAYLPRNLGLYGPPGEYHLLFCGRIKDMIIIHGRNYYPQDIEVATQEASNLIRPGCTAAFAVEDSIMGIERLSIVAEIRAPELDKAAKRFGKESVLRSLALEVGDAVFKETHLQVHTITFIRQKTILKTTSGKIRRRGVKEAFLAKSLRVIHEHVFNFDGPLSPALSGAGSPVMSGARTPIDGLTGTAFKRRPSRPNVLGTTATKADREKHEKVVAVLEKHGVQDFTATCAENGLDSVKLTQLLSEMNAEFDVQIQLNQMMSLSASEVVEVIMSQKGNDGKMYRPKIEDTAKNFVDKRGERLAAPLRMLMQTFGILFVVLCLGLAGVPTYHAGKYIWENFDQPWSYIRFYGGDIREGPIHMIGILLMAIIPGFLFAFTFVVIIMKWLIIGRYERSRHDLYSWYFMRWWTVDRLMDLWENLMGRYILDSFFANIFYKLMGADIYMNNEIKSFIREPDLIKLGSGTTLRGRVYCRLLESDCLWFDTVDIGNLCVIDSMSVVLPGTVITHQTEIRPGSVVLEGSDVQPPPDAPALTKPNRHVWEGIPISYVRPSKEEIARSFISAGDVVVDVDAPRPSSTDDEEKAGSDDGDRRRVANNRKGSLSSTETVTPSNNRQLRHKGITIDMVSSPPMSTVPTNLENVPHMSDQYWADRTAHVNYNSDDENMSNAESIELRQFNTALPPWHHADIEADLQSTHAPSESSHGTSNGDSNGRSMMMSPLNNNRRNSGPFSPILSPTRSGIDSAAPSTTAVSTGVSNAPSTAASTAASPQGSPTNAKKGTRVAFDENDALALSQSFDWSSSKVTARQQSHSTSLRKEAASPEGGSFRWGMQTGKFVGYVCLYMLLNICGTPFRLLMEKYDLPEWRYDIILFNGLAFFSTFFVLSFVTILAKWVLVGRAEAGLVRDSGYKEWSRWFLSLLESVSFNFGMHFIYTRYFNWWLVAMGARIDSMLTTFVQKEYVVPGHSADLLHIEGNGVFISNPDIEVAKSINSDGDTSVVWFGNTMTESGRRPQSSTSKWRMQKRVKIGEKCMIGMRSRIGVGVELGHHSVVGAGTIIKDEAVVPSFTTVMGNPSFQRKDLSAVDDGADGKEFPGLFVVAMQDLLMYFTCLAMMAGYLGCVIPAYEFAQWVDREFPTLPIEAWITLLGISFLIFAISCLLYSTVVKWVFRGRDHPREIRSPPYTMKYFYGYSVSNRIQTLVRKFFLPLFTGTHFAVFYHRINGANVSYGANLFCSTIYDHDLITIEKGATIDDDAYVGGHAQQKNKFITGATRVARSTVIRPHALCMAGTVIEDGGILGARSSCFPGQEVGSGQMWLGHPAVMYEENVLSSSLLLGTYADGRPASKSTVLDQKRILKFHDSMSRIVVLSDGAAPPDVLSNPDHRSEYSVADGIGSPALSDATKRKLALSWSSPSLLQSQHADADEKDEKSEHKERNEPGYGRDRTASLEAALSRARDRIASLGEGERSINNSLLSDDTDQKSDGSELRLTWGGERRSKSNPGRSRVKKGGSVRGTRARTATRTSLTYSATVGRPRSTNGRRSTNADSFKPTWKTHF